MKTNHGHLRRLIALALTGCLTGSCNSRPLTQEATKESVLLEGLVTGSALAGATVRVWRLKEGRRFFDEGSATSGDDGKFSVPIGLGQPPFQIVATGGTSIDPTTKKPQNQRADELTALLTEVPSSGELPRVIVTPVSHWQAVRALKLNGDGAALVDADAMVWSPLNQHFGVDWRKGGALPSSLPSPYTPLSASLPCSCLEGGWRCSPSAGSAATSRSKPASPCGRTRASEVER